MIAKIVFSFALFLAFNSVVNSEDFCSAFGGSNHRISYVIRDYETIGGELAYNLFIGDQYWRAVWAESDLSLSMNPKDSRSSGPFFKGQYSMVVWLRLKDTKCGDVCPFGFTTDNWTQVDVGSDGSRTKPLQDITKVSTVSLDGTAKEPKPVMAFSELWVVTDKEADHKLVLVSKMTKNNLHAFFRYDLEYKDNTLKISRSGDQDTHLKAIRAMAFVPELISVQPQWNDGHSVLNYVFLFVDKMAIKWCTVSQDATPDACKPQTLIQCTPSTTTATSDGTKGPQEEDEDWSMILVIIGVIVVIIVVILILVFIFCCRPQKSGEPAEPQSSVDRKNTARSGIADSPKSEAGKKTSQATGKASDKPSATGSPAVASSSGQNK